MPLKRTTTGKAKKKRGADRPEVRRRATKAQIQQRVQDETARALEGFSQLQEIGAITSETPQDTVQKWMATAAALVDDFRENKELFLADGVSKAIYLDSD
jgi:hypothetical protein